MGTDGKGCGCGSGDERSSSGKSLSDHTVDQAADANGQPALIVRPDKTTLSHRFGADILDAVSRYTRTAGVNAYLRAGGIDPVVLGRESESHASPGILRSATHILDTPSHSLPSAELDRGFTLNEASLGGGSVGRHADYATDARPNGADAITGPVYLCESRISDGPLEDHTLLELGVLREADQDDSGDEVWSGGEDIVDEDEEDDEGCRCAGFTVKGGEYGDGSDGEPVVLSRNSDGSPASVCVAQLFTEPDNGEMQHWLIGAEDARGNPSGVVSLVFSGDQSSGAGKARFTAPWDVFGSVPCGDTVTVRVEPRNTDADDSHTETIHEIESDYVDELLANKPKPEPETEGTCWIVGYLNGAVCGRRKVQVVAHAPYGGVSAQQLPGPPTENDLYLKKANRREPLFCVATNLMTSEPQEYGKSNLFRSDVQDPIPATSNICNLVDNTGRLSWDLSRDGVCRVVWFVDVNAPAAPRKHVFLKVECDVLPVYTYPDRSGTHPFEIWDSDEKANRFLSAIGRKPTRLQADEKLDAGQKIVRYFRVPCSGDLKRVKIEFVLPLIRISRTWNQDSNRFVRTGSGTKYAKFKLYPMKYSPSTGPSWGVPVDELGQHLRACSEKLRNH